MKTRIILIPIFVLILTFIAKAQKTSVSAVTAKRTNCIVVRVKGVEFKMIKVEAGIFQMGSNSGQFPENPVPVHQVILTNDYYIGETEVTQKLWKAVMGSNPSNFTSSDQLPVENVSWNDCQTFITKLNEMTGKNFRLPTEAEWEFAARGGNASQGYICSGSNNIHHVAWYYCNSSGKTHDVATMGPNELGIYDMSGNVYEWCQDWFGRYSSEAQTNPTGPPSGSVRVIRGGSYVLEVNPCHVAARFWTGPSRTHDNLGLRLALSSTESTPSTTDAVAVGLSSAESNPSKTDAVAVDLGLPSGTKWADRNIGASKPEDYGGYYAWGETEEKEIYDWSTYLHCDGTRGTCHDIGYDISGTQYDVVHIKWGGSWKMPTIVQVAELLDNCISLWTSVNGVNGCKFISPNGNSIFLPATGYRWGDGLKLDGSYGEYWSSTFNRGNEVESFGLHSGYLGAFWRYTYGRGSGLSVRPVRKN